MQICAHCRLHLTEYCPLQSASYQPQFTVIGKTSLPYSLVIHILYDSTRCYSSIVDTKLSFAVCPSVCQAHGTAPSPSAGFWNSFQIVLKQACFASCAWTLPQCNSSNRQILTPQQNHCFFRTTDVIWMYFRIYNVLNLYNKVNFITGKAFSNRLGVAAP